MIAAARLDARTAYIAEVGDNPFGRDLLALWRAEGVATDGMCTLAGIDTGLYFVSYGPAGHEFGYLRAGSGAALSDAARQLADMAAALSTQGFGAVAPVPRRAELMAAGAAIV